MLEWTGERFLPWIEDALVAYEHLHRYAFASRFVAGKTVLDIGSGEGYGTFLLAQSASFAVGIDVDLPTIEHSGSKYRRDNLDFVAASAIQLPFDKPFDVVVCFETLEHVENQEGLLSEARRLLGPDGLLIVSTPDKRTYSDEPHFDNPFHAHELYFEEFQELLGRHFNETRFLGQRVYPTSNIWPLDDPEESGFAEYIIERSSSEFGLTESEKPDPLYYIGLASNTSGASGPRSVLIDVSNSYVGPVWNQLSEHSEIGATIQRLLDEHRLALEWKDEQIKDLNGGIRSRDEALAWRASQIEDLKAAAEALRKHIASIEQEQAGTAEYARSLEESIRAKDDYADRLEAGVKEQAQEAADARWKLETLQATRGWQLIMSLRSFRQSIRNVFSGMFGH